MEELKRGRVLKGRYRIEKVLGQGAMGAVYLARDLDLSDALWAIKVLSAGSLPADEATEAVALFQREADLLSRLRHPGLPRVVDAFCEGEEHLLVMELIQGMTLDDLMSARGRPFREEEMLPWLRQLAACLAYLHAQEPHPVIFRDLKPSNCMVTSDGRLQLIDFGIARHYKPGRKSDTIVLGTPGFCAPEQYGTAQTEPRSDLYSLGAMTWHLLSGADPTAVGFDFPPLRQVAPACSSVMERIVARCVAFNSEERYPNARELLADLEYASSPLAAQHERETHQGQPAPSQPLPGHRPAEVGRATRRLASVSATHLGPEAVDAAAVPSAAPFAPVRPDGFELQRRAAPIAATDEGAFLRSWLRRTFQVWWGPGSIYFPRILALMLLTFCLLPFITIWAQSGAASEAESAHRPQAELAGCVRNLQVIGRGLVAFRQRHGAYPQRLGEILMDPPDRGPYGSQLPDISGYGYRVTDHGRHYVVTCEGHNHMDAGVPVGYPRLVDNRIVREPEESP